MGCSSRIFNDRNCTNYAAPRDTNWLRSLLQNRLWRERERAVEMGKGLDLLGLMIPTFCLYFSIFCRLHRGVAAPLDWVAFACDRGFYSQPSASGSIDRLIMINLDGIVMNSDGIMMNNVHATGSGIFPQEDYVGAVPLMFAAKGGSIEAAELLVSRLKWRLWGLSCCGLDEYII